MGLRQTRRKQRGGVTVPPTKRETLIESLQKKETERSEYSEKVHKFNAQIEALKRRKDEQNIKNKPAIEQLEKDIEGLVKHREFWKSMVKLSDTMIRAWRAEIDKLDVNKSKGNENGTTAKRRRPWEGGATLPKSKRERVPPHTPPPNSLFKNSR